MAGIVGQMLNHKLITKQTTRDGVMVNRVMVAEALDIDKETYLAFLMDRATGVRQCARGMLLHCHCQPAFIYIRTPSMQLALNASYFAFRTEPSERDCVTRTR